MRLFGWLIFLGGIAFAGVVVAMPEILLTYGMHEMMFVGTPWVSALTVLLMSIIHAILLLGAAEFILLAVSVDDNTRALKNFFINDKTK